MTTERKIEKFIGQHVIRSLLTAGYTLQWMCDGENLCEASTDFDDLYQAMRQGDDEFLNVFHCKYKNGTPDHIPAGWVRFIYGNGNKGLDVISDYTTGLEAELKPVFDLIKQAEESEGPLSVLQPERPYKVTIATDEKTGIKYTPNPTFEELNGYTPDEYNAAHPGVVKQDKHIYDLHSQHLRCPCQDVMLSRNAVCGNGRDTAPCPACGLELNYVLPLVGDPRWQLSPGQNAALKGKD